jgi:hypothetical protein
MVGIVRSAVDHVAYGHLVRGGRCVRVAAGEPHRVATGGARVAMPLAKSRLLTGTCCNAGKAARRRYLRSGRVRW